MLAATRGWGLKVGMGCVESPICWLLQGVGVGMGCVERAPFAGCYKGWGLKVGMGCVERAPFAGCYKQGVAATRGWDGLCRKSPICWLLQGVGG